MSDREPYVYRRQDVSPEATAAQGSVNELLAALADRNAMRTDILFRHWVLQSKCGACGRSFLEHTLVDQEGGTRWLAPRELGETLPEKCVELLTPRAATP